MKTILLPETDASPLHSFKGKIKWNNLIEKLSNHFNLIDEFSNIDDSTIAILLFNHEKRYNNILNHFKKKKYIKILRIVTESPIINFQFSPKINSFYEHTILTTNLHSEISFNYSLFHPPLRSEPLDKRVAEKLFQNKSNFNNIALIASNYYSFHPEENYSIRREIVRSLGSNKIKLDVIGKNWHTSRAQVIREFISQLRINDKISITKFIKSYKDFSNYQDYNSINFHGYLDGRISDLLEEYTFGIVSENYRYYISEKFFEMSETGTIPMIFGDPKSFELYPNNSFVPIFTNNKILEQIFDVRDDFEYLDFIRGNLINFLSDKNDLKYCYNFQSGIIADFILDYLKK